MTGRDDEFDDFLSRRRRLFGRAPDDDMLEPPAELDRIVLRQARDAIEAERAPQVYRGPRWGAPLAIAATLVLAFTVVFQMMPAKRSALAAEDSAVALQNTAREVDATLETARAAAPERSAPGAASAVPSDGAVIVDLSHSTLEKEAAPRAAASPRTRVNTNADVAVAAAAAPPSAADAQTTAYAMPPPPARSPAVASRLPRGEGASMATAGAAEKAAAAPAQAAPADDAAAEWRRNEKSWLAKIEELRKAGDIARADAEFAAYKQQRRAFSSAPDR